VAAVAPPPPAQASHRRLSRAVTAAATILVAAATAAHYGASADGLISAVAAGVLVVLAAIDIEQRRVPNAIVLPAAAVVLLARMVSDPHPVWVWPAAAFGAALAFFILAIIYPPGLGMGDVKLVLLIGATLGSSVLLGLVIGTLAGGVASAVVLLRRNAAGSNRTIAYAPYLCFGALVVLTLLRH
jgi:leader peptidase (prepilin peptidase) / N-methyltransferase